MTPWSLKSMTRLISIVSKPIVKTTTQPQLNQTKPNNQQINKSWVLQENDFAQHHPTPPTETLLSALEQYRPTLG